MPEFFYYNSDAIELECSCPQFADEDYKSKEKLGIGLFMKIYLNLLKMR